jgi:hypothetical protein
VLSELKSQVEIVTRFKRAWLVILEKTNTPEFGTHENNLALRHLSDNFPC